MIQLFYWYAAKTTCRTSIILWDRRFGIFKGIKKQFGTWSFEQKLSLIWIAIKSTVDAINATVALIFRLNRLHTIIQFNKRNKCAMHTSQVVQSLLTHLNNVYGIKQFNFIYQTRLALASILWPFLVYLLKFTLLTPFLHTFFFFLLLFGSHPGSLMHYLGFILLEFPVGKHTSMIAISSLDFVLLSCLHVPLRNALLKITKYMSSTGIIRNFGRLRAILWNGFNRLSRLNFTRERDSSLVPIKWPCHLHAEAV